MPKRFIASLRNEFSGYSGQKLTKDVMAGITVAAVALPLALAFGVGSGASAASGMITAIVAGLVIGGLSGASYQISGPTGAMTAILLTLVQKFGLNGIFVAGFMAGILLLIAGIFRLGRVISLIPSSVITGFTSGIAIIIALGQLDNFFGVTSEGSLAIEKFLSYFTAGFAPDLPTVAIGLFVVAVMLLWPAKWNAKLPSSLVSLILVLIVNRFLQLDVAVVGEIPQTLFLPERLNLAAVSPEQFNELLVPALSIAALAMIESLLCGASAGKMKNEKLDGDQELLAQGIGNIIIPFFGGVPATAAIARTSVAIKSGAETRLAGIVHAVVLMLSMFLLAPVMSQIPLSALAGVLLVTAWRMNDWENIRYIFNNRFKWGMIKFFATMVATVLLDLTQAIVIGVALSACFIVIRMADIDVTITTVDNKRLERIGIEIQPLPEHVQVAYITGTVFFGSLERLSRSLEGLNASVLILSMRGVPTVDLSGVQRLVEIASAYQAAGTEVMIASVQPKVLELLTRGGIHQAVHENHVFPTAAEAIVHAAQEHVDSVEAQAIQA